MTAKGKDARRQWVLDADLTAAFDRIGHDHLLASLGAFPARGMTEQWLKAGVVEKDRSAPTEEGTPQGGVVSPVLLNVACTGWRRPLGSATGKPAPTPGTRSRTPQSWSGMPTT